MTWQCEYFSDVGQYKSSLMYVINYLSLTQGLADVEHASRIISAVVVLLCVLVGGFHTECI